MLKKVVPVVAISSFLLVGCNMDNTVPNNNETPMEEVRDDVDRIVPDPEVNTPSPTNENGNGMFNNNNDNDGLNGGPNGGTNGKNGTPDVYDNTVPNGNDNLTTPNAKNAPNMNNDDMNK